MVGDIKSGTVEASSVYIPCLDINNLSTYNYTIDPKHSPYRMFLGVGTYSQDLIVNLPSPTTYEGLELRFYSRSRTRSGAPMVLCGLIMYGTGTGLESANRVRIGWNELTVLLAFGGAWHVIIGSVEKIS